MSAAVYCPRCSEKRIAAYRYCRQCGFDLETKDLAPNVAAEGGVAPFDARLEEQPERLAPPSASPTGDLQGESGRQQTASPAPAATGPDRVARSATTRANVAMVLLGITAAVLALAALHTLSGIDLIDNLATKTDADLTAFDNSTQSLGGAYLLAVVATAVAFLAWLSRAVNNVGALGGGTPLVTPRWSIGWWFVPFANFVMPFRIVKDLDRRMSPADSPPSVMLLGWWWALIVGGNVASGVINQINYQTADEAKTFFAVSALTDAVTIAAATLAILVVRRIQGNADLRIVAAGRVDHA